MAFPLFALIEGKRTASGIPELLPDRSECSIGDKSQVRSNNDTALSGSFQWIKYPMMNAVSMDSLDNLSWWKPQSSSPTTQLPEMDALVIQHEIGDCHTSTAPTSLPTFQRQAHAPDVWVDVFQRA